MVPTTQSFRLHDVPSEVGGAWRAAYAVGTPISALVTGICCALAIEYFQQFPQDAARIRLSVIVVVATTILGLLLAMDLTYVRLVKNVTPPVGFGDIPWQDDAVALICGICQLICSAYFAYSAYCVATRKKILLVWYALLMTGIFLSAFFRAILGLTPKDWFESDGAALCPKMTFMWLIGSLLLDFSIAFTLLAHLREKVPTRPAHSIPPASTHFNVPNFQLVAQPPLPPLLSRLLTTILTSFSLTAILMFSLLILVMAMHGTEFDPRLPKATAIFTALRLLATPTYAITFLYTLNRRNTRGVLYHGPILNQPMLPLVARKNQDPHCVVEHPRIIKQHDLTVQFPSRNFKPKWPTYFAILDATTTSSRSVRQANGTGHLGKKCNSDVSTAFSSSSNMAEMSLNDVQAPISEVHPAAQIHNRPAPRSQTEYQGRNPRNGNMKDIPERRFLGTYDGGIGHIFRGTSL